MKGPLAKLIYATIFCGICLWFGIKWFVGGTDELASNINVRSLAHLREGYQSNVTIAAAEPVAAKKIVDPLSIGLTRRERVKEAPLPDNTKQNDEQDKQVDEADDDAENAEDADEQDPEIIVVETTGNRESDGPSQDDVYVRLTESEKREQDKLIASTSLGKEELDARAAARRKRLEDLGILPKAPPAPTIAVDASLEMPDKCKNAAIARVPIGLKFRFESSFIKGESLNALESLVSLYRQCEEGQFILAENPLGRTDATEKLTQMRFDEIKYFFIQHSVSIDAVQFPEE